MFRRKAAKEGPRLVWRMTAENPAGEFVSQLRPKRAVPDPRDPGASWQESTLDLLDGVELTESDWATLPGELIEELLKRRT